EKRKPARFAKKRKECGTRRRGIPAPQASLGMTMFQERARKGIVKTGGRNWVKRWRILLDGGWDSGLVVQFIQRKWQTNGVDDAETSGTGSTLHDWARYGFWREFSRRIPPAGANRQRCDRVGSR